MKKDKIKKQIRRVVEGLTEEVLVIFYTSPLTMAESYRRLQGFAPNVKELSKKQLYDTVERVRRQGWIEKKVVEDQIFYSLTAKGRVKQLVFKLRIARKQRGEQSTFLIFDIPEEKRTYRTFLRRLLKQMKFTAIQKSVLVTPFILPQEFYDLLKEMDLLRFVKVIEGRIRY
jgi:DNA-binding PadR family transcriptional regulator